MGRLVAMLLLKLWGRLVTMLLSQLRGPSVTILLRQYRGLFGDQHVDVTFVGSLVTMLL